MTDIPESNFPFFSEVAKVLRHDGYDILSPHEILHGGDKHFNPDYSHSDYIRADMQLGLMQCDALVLLPGWPKSKGAVAELHAAAHMGYEIYYYHPRPPGYDLIGMS